jgi:transposase
MNYTHYVGIDISKLTIDVVLFSGEDHSNYQHQVFSNDYTGFDKMEKWIRSLTDTALEKILFCCEHTGLYALPICRWMVAKDAKLWVENALQIKRSIGLKRGKSDKADAYAIADYGFSKQYQARLYKQPDANITQLKHLLTQREHLVRHQVSFKSSISEFKGFDEQNAAFCINQNKELIKYYTQKIKDVDEQLAAIVMEDSDLKKKFDLVCSVHGIGKQTALFILIHTKAFTEFDDYRKFACYCGIAPFPYGSGTSIRGRDRISNLANKKIKTLLTMCCLNVLKGENEFQNYYRRKKAEGKSFLSILNAIKNKLISRIFAVIRKGVPYQMELNPT